MYQASLEKTGQLDARQQTWDRDRNTGEERQTEATRPSTERHYQQVEHENERSKERSFRDFFSNVLDKPGETEGLRAAAEEPRERQQTEEETEVQRIRQYPEAPPTRRPNPDSQAYGGWDVLDSFTVDQCAVRPPGMQTVEFVPNSLHEEWTEA